MPEMDIRRGRYRMRFAHTAPELELVFRLRYEVFNLELDEGLQSSSIDGLDRDRFDPHCMHLFVTDERSDKVVGTYRLQLPEVARRAHGLYVESEFDLSGVPREVLDHSIELGRACIAKAHRCTKVLHLLWCGLVSSLDHYERRYFFGCSSLTSQDPAEGLRLSRDLDAAGHRHPNFSVKPLPNFECVTDRNLDELPQVPVPTLFGTYLRLGAQILGPPALDREFGTIDFLTLMDVANMGPEAMALFE